MSMNINSKIFIAGHRGLLGSAILRQLTALGHENLLLRTSKELDLTDLTATKTFFAHEQPEYVFLAAAKVGGIQANINEPATFLLDNLQIQNHVISCSHQYGVKKLLFVGSSCIYPKEATSPIAEEALLTGPLEPTNEGYAIAKLAGVRLCQFYRKQHGCHFISAIPTNLFGINDHYDPIKSHLVPALILKIHQAKRKGASSIDLWGSGRPRREFMLSDECAKALYFLMKNYDEAGPINIGTGIDHSVTEIASIVSEVIGIKLSFTFDPTKPDGMLRKLVDTSKLSTLGWRSTLSLEEGVKIAYQDFLRKNP